MYTSMHYLDDLFNLKNAFDSFFNDSGTVSTRYPLVNIYESDDSVRVQALIPGMKKDQIEIKFENGLLTLSGSCLREEKEKIQYLREERQFGDFHKVIKISSPVDAESITARMENGVLFVEMKKKESAKPKTIRIS